MKKWKEVEREIVAERLKETAFKPGDGGVREFTERHRTSQTEFYWT